MTLGQLLSQGGWAMWPIYLCSFVALFFFCERYIYFWRIRARDLVWLDPVLERMRQRDLASAAKLCAAIKHPIAEVLGSATEMARQRPDRAAAEAERVGQLALGRYERFLPLLSFIAQVAPLLGLLGTVLGMVKMFYGLQKMGMANVDASALSTGIWQALLTTAAGLIVAAPTLAAFMYLTARIDRFRSQMSDVVSQWLSVLPEKPNNAALEGGQDV